MSDLLMGVDRIERSEGFVLLHSAKASSLTLVPRTVMAWKRNDTPGGYSHLDVFLFGGGHLRLDVREVEVADRLEAALREMALA